MEYLSISVIVDKYIGDSDLYEAGGGNKRLKYCPFCGEKNKAYIHTEKNTFTCFSEKCQSEGRNYGFFRFYKALTNNDSISYRDMMIDLNNGCSNFLKTDPKIEKGPKKQEKLNLATHEHRNIIYTEFLRRLDLRDEHFKDLINRGLTGNQIIESQYKSVPATKKELDFIVKKMAHDGFDFTGVPGFYKNNGKWESVKPMTGMFVPFKSIKNTILGMQYRLDGEKNIEVVQTIKGDYVEMTVTNRNLFHVKVDICLEIQGVDVKTIMKNAPKIKLNEDQSLKNVLDGALYKQKNVILNSYETKRYIYHISLFSERVEVRYGSKYYWFSSGKQSDNCGTPCTGFFHHIGEIKPQMYLTEGALKATVAYYLCGEKRSFVAIPGVSITNKLPDLFKKYVKLGVEEINLCFDMDKDYNLSVQKGAENVRKYALESGLRFNECSWDRKFKGIDDYILNYNNKKTV